MTYNCSTSLQSLSLAELVNPLKKTTIEQLCTLLTTCGKQGNLVTLSLERCTLSNKRVTQMLTSLPAAMRCLHMKNMDIPDDALFKVPTLLEAPRTRLQALNLRGNALKVESAMALAQGLIDNTTIKVLDLSCNQLGSKGVMLLCEALKGNKHI